MSFNSVWLYFFCMTVVFMVAKLPLFSIADQPPASGGRRISNIDGLRGFLAYGVFFFHAVSCQRYIIRPYMDIQPSAFYFLLGEIGVAIFFMITGYLFWGRMIDERGKPNWLKLYVGRAFRIGPLYLFTIGLMFLLVLRETGFQLNVPLKVLLLEIARWLPLGLLKRGQSLNGYHGLPLDLIGIVWTLSLEWKFYFSLLLTSRVMRFQRAEPFFLSAGLIMALTGVIFRPHEHWIAYTAFFFNGMICATLSRRNLLVKFPDLWKSLIIVSLIAALPIFFTTTRAFFPIILLGLAFYGIISGGSVFGLLNTQAAHRMGNVSYGIYLLQSTVLALFFILPSNIAHALVSPVLSWAVVLASAITLLIFATFAHVWIELPGIEAGKRVAKKLSTLPFFKIASNA